MIYIVYKVFKADFAEAIPVAAYTDVIDAAKTADRLNLDRTPQEIEDGVEYYFNNRGVPLNV